MRQKIKFALLTLLSISVNSMIGCQNITDVSAVNNKAVFKNGLKTVNNLEQAKDILQDDEIHCEKEAGTGFAVKAENLIQEAKGPKVPDSNKVDSEKQDPGEMPRFSKNKKLNIPYSTAKPVSPDMRNGYVNVTFKDEYKVRFDKEKKFTSSDKEEVKEIKNLMKEYHIKQVGDFLGSITQEQADEQERISEANSDYDQPNRGSQYILLVENINVKEFVDKLRTSSLVREANIPDEVVSTTPSEPIFLNPKSLLTNGYDFSDESIRYWDNRVNAEKARTIVSDNGINPAAVAVIDEGFVTGENPTKIIEDIPVYNLTDKAVCDSINPCKSPSLNNGSQSDYDVEWYQELKVVNGVTKTVYNDHGIGVASLIGAPSYNGKGTAGLASINYNQNVTIVPIKFKGSNGIVNAINYIIDHRTHNNVKVINISQGIPINDTSEITLPVDTNSSISAAIKAAYDVGILTVISAGNSNQQINNTGPISKALMVGGTAKYTNTRWFTPDKLTTGTSSYGPRVDMAAPAEAIVIPTRNNDYVFSQGTSLSVPMVAATASLLMGTRADGKTHLRNGTPESVDRVKNLLFNSGTLIQADQPLGLRKSNVDNSIPNGVLLNMGRALELAMQIDPTKNYVRLFNTDYYSEAVINNNNNNLLYTYYKEDKIKEVPPGSGTLTFNTFNKSCVYSWGYQL